MSKKIQGRTLFVKKKPPNGKFKLWLGFFIAALGLLYGVIFMVLLIIAIIPVGLGLVIVVPMMMTSLYTSYTDIFSIEQPQS